MGCNRAAAFLLIALLSVAATPPAHGQVPELGLSVSGRLCCTATGNCPGQGLRGQAVRLNCTNIFGATTTVGRSTTDADGGFVVNAPRMRGLLLSGPVLPCIASFELPVDGALCPALSKTNGVLQSLVGVVGSLAPGTVVSGTTLRFSVRQR